MITFGSPSLIVEIYVYMRMSEFIYSHMHFKNQAFKIQARAISERCVSHVTGEPFLEKTVEPLSWQGKAARPPVHAPSPLRAQVCSRLKTGPSGLSGRGVCFLLGWAQKALDHERRTQELLLV